MVLSIDSNMNDNNIILHQVNFNELFEQLILGAR